MKKVTSDSQVPAFGSRFIRLHHLSPLWQSPITAQGHSFPILENLAHVSFTPPSAAPALILDDFDTHLGEPFNSPSSPFPDSLL